jgi:hypothetical protein
MPQNKDYCRVCGATVELGENGAVCQGCSKTVCEACAAAGPCPEPHQDYAPTPGPVSAAEHAQLKAILEDPDALEKHLKTLRAARGEKAVGI